jgi:hypothetical protein
MHNVLTQFISERIHGASTFVLNNMPCSLSSDEVYEGLVGDANMLADFDNATRHLRPASMARPVIITTTADNGETLQTQVIVRLTPTSKHRAFLMPENIIITRESDLGRMLALPLRVAQDWKMLTRVWNTLHNTCEDDPMMLAFLFPWIRQLIADFPGERVIVELRRSEMATIAREVKQIMSNKLPRDFPRLTRELNALCQSGKRLFAQYNMIEATAQKAQGMNDYPVIRVDAAGPMPATGIDLVPAWVNAHLTEVTTAWGERAVS